MSENRPRVAINPAARDGLASASRESRRGWPPVQIGWQDARSRALILTSSSSKFRACMSPDRNIHTAQPIPVSTNDGTRWSRWSGCAATQADNFHGRSVAPDVSRAGNPVGFQFIPAPAACTVRPTAGTVQGPLLPRSLDDRFQVRAIWVGAEAHKVPGQALRAFNAMTDAPRHVRHHAVV